MIPKIIHYVWVGGKPLNQLAEKCIESWKKFCPDYEIKRWDETNFDINSDVYCKQAYEHKKYAFVSDYIRLKVLHEFGGIYMDTDVELIKPLTEFMNHSAFICYGDGVYLNTGLIGASKGNSWLESLYNTYNQKNFVKEDGSLDIITNFVTIANITKELYPEFAQNNTMQTFKDLVIYPRRYFCPPLFIEPEEVIISAETCAIHYFMNSWAPQPNFSKKIIRKCKYVCKKLLGKKNLSRLRHKLAKKKGW